MGKGGEFLILPIKEISKMATMNRKVTIKKTTNGENNRDPSFHIVSTIHELV